MANLVIFGAGNQARVVLEALNGNKEVNVLGLMADNELIGTLVRGFPILGGFANVPMQADCYHVAIGDGLLRERTVRFILAQRTMSALAVIHPTAIIASTALICPGAFIGPRAVLHNGSVAWAHSIVNTGAILEHDCHLGEFSHLCPGAVTGGCVAIGRQTTIGLGACIRDHISIGERCLIGMGSVVTKSIRPGVVVYGNPAREIRENEAR